MYTYLLATPEYIQQVQLNSHVTRIFSIILGPANMILKLDISSFHLCEYYCLQIK